MLLCFTQSGGTLDMKIITITDRLEMAADNGAYEIALFVWNTTVKRLSKQDITFTDQGLSGCRKGERYYLISWKDAIVSDLPDNWNIEEVVHERNLSQGQILWLMAEDTNRKKAATN